VKHHYIIIFFLFSILPDSLSQKTDISGYIKDMQAIYYFNQSDSWTTYNQIHNRINFNWQPTEKFRLEAGIRNRIISGKLVSQITGYSDLLEKDDGLFDLSWNLANQKNWFLNTTLDRLYIDYSFNNFQIRAGRQRINWGINLVWNPNDLFNTFSYVDFDYEERPGSDAVTFTWYTSPTSNIDLAAKSDSSGETVIAARYRFNMFDYDFQIIGGKYYDDVVLGGGWSGDLGNICLRGELSAFLSQLKLSSTLSGDYTFNNSLYVHFSFLYNSSGSVKPDNSTGLSLLNPSYKLSAKKLSLGKYEIFSQISYPLSPITTINIAGILNPSDKSYFIGPSCMISLQDNIELLLTGQFFDGVNGSEYGFMGGTYSLFGRLRWSF